MQNLEIRAFHIDSVLFNRDFNITKNTLSLANAHKFDTCNDLIKTISVSIINPYKHNIYVNSIMDIMPISTKVIGKLGEGITNTLTGVYVMVTGANESGKQIHEFGSSEGKLEDKLIFGRAGSPLKSDYIIHIDVILSKNTTVNRTTVMSIFKESDNYIQKIRNILKEKSPSDATEKHTYRNNAIRSSTKLNVVVCKQVAGQGAMHETLLFPQEPSGINNGISIIDIGNMPIFITPNEYRDGALRSLT